MTRLIRFILLNNSHGIAGIVPMLHFFDQQVKCWQIMVFFRKWDCEVYQQQCSNYQWLQIKTPNIPYMDHWLQRDGWFQLAVDKAENTFTSRQDLPLDSDFFWPKSHFWKFLDILNPISSHFSKHWCSKAHVFPRLFRFLILFATLQSHGVHYYPQGVGHLQVTGQQKCLDPNDDNWLAFVGA